ncbi:unnamed protein product [Linum trigynum]|uniref:Uncharacterized protein n=1 Tax=Linum trigynum TaxID=586398 RepID=A0AAV2GQP8_9ROSI
MGCEPVKLDFDDKVESRSTEELVLSLRREFQLSKFQSMASILACGEKKLKLEIEAKVEDLKKVRSEKVRLEDELKRCKEECSILKLQLEAKKEMELRVTKFEGCEEDVETGEVQEQPPEDRGESVRLTAEGNGIANASSCF